MSKQRDFERERGTFLCWMETRCFRPGLHLAAVARLLLASLWHIRSGRSQSLVPASSIQQNRWRYLENDFRPFFGHFSPLALSCRDGVMAGAFSFRLLSSLCLLLPFIFGLLLTDILWPFFEDSSAFLQDYWHGSSAAVLQDAVLSTMLGASRLWLSCWRHC